MTEQFTQFTARDYEFRRADTTVDRHVIALKLNGRRVGFIEYSAARIFVDVIHDLCDEHEAKLRKVRHDPDPLQSSP